MQKVLASNFASYISECRRLTAASEIQKSEFNCSQKASRHADMKKTPSAWMFALKSSCCESQHFLHISDVLHSSEHRTLQKNSSCSTTKHFTALFESSIRSFEWKSSQDLHPPREDELKRRVSLIIYFLFIYFVLP